jgi:hypothetical protein
MFELDEISIEDFSGNKKNIREVHRFYNGKPVASAFFENFKKIRELNFNESEKFETIYEYHEHYYLKLFYDDSKNSKGGSISIKNPFEGPNKFETYGLVSKEWLEKNIKEEKGLTKFTILKVDDDEISYTFNGTMLVEIIFKFKTYQDSYHVTVDCNEDGKTYHYKKNYFNNEDYFTTKIFEFEENMVIEKQWDNIQYTVSDEQGRVRRMGCFRNNEERLDLFKHYMKTEDQETFSKIMKEIYLETSDYDEFDNLVMYKTEAYRPDFSKDHLTSYDEQINYFDKYNIKYGDEYIETKEDYDYHSENLNRLEYLEGRVNKYNKKDELVAVYYIENEKKTHAEFFSPTYFATEKYDEYGNAIELYTENKVTNTIETIRHEIVYQ